MNLRFSPKLFVTLVVICRIYSVQTNEKVPCSATKGTDCSHILEINPFSSSGTYTIKPKCSTKSFQVYCDMDMDTGIGWTVIQRHNGQDSLSFSRTWDEYKQGFGSLTGEHWLGLDNIHTLTRQDLKVVRLLVCLEDYSDNKATALYSKFTIEDETHNYKIKLGKYEGTAGDGFRGRDEDTNEDGSYFSTWDRDNDDCPKLDIDRMCMRGDIAFFSCSQSITDSGWWFKRCGIADLNGIWQEKGNHTGWLSGIHWETWKRSESLKSSEMKLHIF